MDHYLDIRVLPDPEFAPPLLMNALHAKLHRALVHLACNDIGLSFPDYGKERLQLGSKIRLHGSADRLNELMGLNWLTGMRDHIRVNEILKAPDSAQQIAVRRVQAKSSAERIRRRQMRRHGFTAEEALERIPASVEKQLKLPFLTSKSASSEQIFRLFIKQNLVDALVAGAFNAYGLSAEATLPHF